MTQRQTRETPQARIAHWRVAVAATIALTAWTAGADERGDALLAATRKGDAASVKRLLDEGADVNTRTRYASTPLFFACDRGHLEIARILIERGADVNVKDNFYNATALTWAMSKKHMEIAALLIEKGADATDALRGSIQEGDRPLLQMVLDKGKLSQAALDDALLYATVAKNDKNTGMDETLRDKGGRLLVFPVDDKVLKEYEGKYSNDDMNMTFAVREGKLSFVGTQSTTDLFPSAKDRFKFVQAGLEFTFERDAAGNVVGVKFASRGGDLKLKRIN